MGRAFARIVNVKELLANEAVYLQQIGDMSTVPILSVRQTVATIGKPLGINISSTCIKPCNGNAEYVG